MQSRLRVCVETFCQEILGLRTASLWGIGTATYEIARLKKLSLNADLI